MNHLSRDEDTPPYLIERVMPPNLEWIRTSLPHRLYADKHGSWMEICTKSVQSVYGEKHNTNGVIVGVTVSGYKGLQILTFFLDENGCAFIFDDHGGKYRVNFEVDVLYMLLNPLKELNGWILNDVKEAKRQYTPKTYPMIGMRTNFGYTDTFHPELSHMIERVRDAVKSQL